MRTIAVAAALAIVAAACGSDSKSSSRPRQRRRQPPRPAASDHRCGRRRHDGWWRGDDGRRRQLRRAAAGSSGTGSAGCAAIDTSLDAKSRQGGRRVHVRPAVRRQDAAQGRGRPDRDRLPEPRGRPERQLPRGDARCRGRGQVHQRGARRLGFGHPERQARPADPARGVQDGDLARTTRSAARTRSSPRSPTLAVSTINFFGNHLPIYEAAGIPAIVTSPVTIADFTSKSAYAIAGGGGCLGAAHRRSSSTPRSISRPSASPCRGPTRRPASCATTTWRTSRSTCSRAR